MQTGDVVQLINDLVVQWGYWIVFGLLLLENTFLLGVLLPGTLVLVFGGYYASTGSLNLLFVFVSAFLGTIAGDTISYLLGRYFGSKLTKFPESVQDMASKNSWGLLFFHHVPYGRLFIPVFFGVNRPVSIQKWLILDVVSAILFVVSYSLIGFYGGQTIEQVQLLYDDVQIVFVFIGTIFFLFWLKVFIQRFVKRFTSRKEE